MLGISYNAAQIEQNKCHERQTEFYVEAGLVRFCKQYGNILEKLIINFSVQSFCLLSFIDSQLVNERKIIV